MVASAGCLSVGSEHSLPEIGEISSAKRLDQSALAESGGDGNSGGIEASNCKGFKPVEIP